MKKILLSLCFAAAALGAQAAAPCTPVGLRCEHLETPLGIDAPAPRLGWRLDDSRSGALQRAYRVVVGRDSAAVAAGCGDVWDSGRTDSDGMLVRYAGPKLDPFTRYYWAVTVWDKDYARSSSGVAAFETGMMGAGNWQGCWISDHHDINHKPAPYFRKEFSVGKRVKSARAYVAAAGLYELHINGRKVGDHRLDPMYTRFDRRNLYVTYDVTRQLQDGANAVGILLGNGWYNHQSGAVWNFERAPWRNRPAFCFDLRIEYADGTHEVVKSDLDWRTSGGPLVFNSIYTSEHYDARLEQPGWSSPGFDDSAWGGVMYRGAPSQRVTAQQTVPIRNVTEYRPRSVRKLDERSYLYDFGQNMAGVTKLRLRGEAGTQLRLIHAERLREDGHADLSNIDVYFRPTDKDDLFQTDVVTLSGRDDEFMPRFNYKGFRYVEVVADRPVELSAENLTAYAMHSDVTPVGHIETSNDLVDKLWDATNKAYLSNLMGYPTDCPQREKNGWTGDGHLAIETALYNYDGITVYEKWLADHRDEQQPNGVLPDIIPTGGWGYGTANGLDWTSTIAIIPWNLYLFYGDTKPLEDCYENIKRYVDYVDRRSPGHLSSWGRGDWVCTAPQKLDTFGVFFMKYNYEIRLKAVKLVLEGGLSVREAGCHLGCGRSQVHLWVTLFERHGLAGLKLRHGSYSAEFKLSVLKHMHQNHLSLLETAVHFGIPGPFVIRQWERLYQNQGAEGLRRKPQRRRPAMSKSKTKKVKLKTTPHEELLKELEYLRAENAYLKKLQALVEERIVRESGKEPKPSKD